jgi:uncharacterized protein (TIGR00251 family)
VSWLGVTATGVRLQLHVQPRAARTEVAGQHGEALKIRLAAPPVDGAANALLLRWLAERLGITRSGVTLVSGAGSRRKVVEVTGITAESIRARLEETTR